jgi:hypothetical protein
MIRDRESTGRDDMAISQSAELFAATRDGWHRVAEHVLAAAQYGETGKMSLRPVAGGFQTTRPLRGNTRQSVLNTARRRRRRRGAHGALVRLTTELGAPPQQPILWPEHFDVGITLGKVNYGASPGDDDLADPYLYVGPHGGPPVRDAFWNAAFGAVRTIEQVASIDEAVAFFRAGTSG